MSDRPRIPDDWALVEAIRAGQRGAFESLVHRYERQVANLIYLSLGSRHDVEDLTQEVFLRVHQALPRLKPQSSLFSWIYRIAVNLCIDESRRRKLRRYLSLEFLAEEDRLPIELSETGDDPEQSAEHKDRKRIILASMQRLPADQRIVVVLREYEHLTYEEIAETLHLTVPAVKTRLFRGRRRLRELLEPILGSGT